MGNTLGGDPAYIEAGAQQLTSVVSGLKSDGTGVGDACRDAAAAGNATLEASIERFSAAWSRMLEDMSAQLAAAQLLAQSGSQDLGAATGGPGRRAQ